MSDVSAGAVLTLVVPLSLLVLVLVLWGAAHAGLLGGERSRRRRDAPTS